MSCRILLILLVGTMSVAACSSSDDTSTETSVADAVATTAATSTTEQPTTTETPTTTMTSTTATVAATTTSSTLPPVPGGFDVTIETVVTPGTGEDWAGLFTSTGPAVDEGVVCAAGSLQLQVFDTGLATWRVQTTFVCDDGSGKFWVDHDLDAVITDDAYTESGTWMIRIGTDAYEGLIGNGTDQTAETDTGVYVSVMEGQAVLSSE